MLPGTKPLRGLGAMRHQLVFEAAPEDPQSDGAGGVNWPWTRYGPFWACVEPLSGRELVNAQQLKPTISHRVTMRDVTSIAPIAPSGRFLLDATGRLLNIDFVFHVDERAGTVLSILCTEEIVPSAS